MEKVLPCALVMMPRTDWRSEKSSSIRGKPNCVESALMERFLAGKLSVAITIHAMGIFSDGSHRMVYKVILLMREYLCRPFRLSEKYWWLKTEFILSNKNHY